jgi:hypothetical protein
MRQFTWELATETEGLGGLFKPAADAILVWHMIKGRIDFNCGEKTRVKLEPIGIRQAGRIKTSSPSWKSPGTRADANFLLVLEIQALRKSKLNRRAREEVDVHVGKCAKNKHLAFWST